MYSYRSLLRYADAEYGRVRLCRFEECRMITKAHQWVPNNPDPRLVGRFCSPNNLDYFPTMTQNLDRV